MFLFLQKKDISTKKFSGHNERRLNICIKYGAVIILLFPIYSISFSAGVHLRDFVVLLFYIMFNEFLLFTAALSRIDGHGYNLRKSNN